MKKLYRFRWDCRRMGNVEGTFVTDEYVVDRAIGRQIYFGEILGKHSEVYGILATSDLTVLSEDQVFIEKFVDLKCSSGYNPLDYLGDD